MPLGKDQTRVGKPPHAVAGHVVWKHPCPAGPCRSETLHGPPTWAALLHVPSRRPRVHAGTDHPSRPRLRPQGGARRRTEAHVDAQITRKRFFAVSCHNSAGSAPSCCLAHVEPLFGSRSFSTSALVLIPQRPQVLVRRLGLRPVSRRLKIGGRAQRHARPSTWPLCLLY